MQRFGPNELLEDVHQRGLCVGCGACVELCPYFKTYKGKTAMLFPCDLAEGRCHAYCPKAELDLDELSRQRWGAPYDPSPVGPHRRILAAGGTVSALMGYALETGRVEGAVLTDREGLLPRPRVVHRLADVLRCATSKYTAAPTLSALNQAVRKGSGRLGVVGTPCQTAAVTQMRANPMESADFEDPVSLVIGLFCTWALDTRKLMEFLSQRLDVEAIRKMDIPPPPAEILVVETRDGRAEIPLSEIRPLVPEGCLICPDMTAEWADVSVGVMEDRPDWNTLIVRSEQGDALVRDAVADGWLITEPFPRANLEHLEFAAGNKKRRALIKAGSDSLLNTRDGEGRSALRVDPRTAAAIIGEQEG
jgi:coenzyme F420 hydrogenase subunit beta